MAWRLDRAVVRGEIDNRTPGLTTGRLWLLGREEPLELELHGDCWRDVAGCLVEFLNPNPEPAPNSWAGLATLQTGTVGDITVSRRVRVPAEPPPDPDTLGPDEPEVPAVWINLVSIEWFSQADGRVLVESSSFSVRQSEPAWRMDADEEQAQRLANLQAMRDHMAVIIGRNETEDSGNFLFGESDADEFVWEERLKESDRLADAYEEVVEKYADEPDGEQKEAFVMGWDGLLEAMADEAESEDEEDEEDYEEDLFGDNQDAPAETHEAWQTAGDRAADTHPLQARAHELALRAMQTVRREAGDGGEGTAANRMVANLLQVSGKLAGALNGRASGYQPETGFVLAVLKRCLGWLNEAIAAANELLDQANEEEQRTVVGSLRLSAFEVREEIVALRRQLQKP